MANGPRALRRALGGSYGGPSIGIENGEWILYTWTDAPVGEEILVRHKDWNTFQKLVGDLFPAQPRSLK